MKNDLGLIGGEFFELTLPKEKRYLWKYFSTDIQKHFLRYFFTFDSYLHFSEHTGYKSTLRYAKKMKRMLVALEKAHHEAKSSADFEKLALIESGRYEDRYNKIWTRKPGRQPK